MVSIQNVVDVYKRQSQDIINHLFNLTHLIRLIGVALIILLTGAAIFIISNTIRLTVFARRKEIAIMKYVGATDWFIRWPFLLEGICLGFIGGGLATIFLYIVYNQVTQEIYEAMAFFPLIPQHPFIDYISLAILVAGIIKMCIRDSVYCVLHQCLPNAQQLHPFSILAVHLLV